MNTRAYRTIFALALMAPLLGVRTVAAAPITYTVTLNASGSLAGSAFTNQTVVLTGTGDTDNVTNQVQVFLNTVSLAFTLSGTTTGTFTNPIDFFSNHDLILGGFTDTFAAVTIVSIGAPAFSTYSPATALSPVTGTGHVFGLGFATSAGALKLDSVGTSTFRADLQQTVPEPGVLLLLTIGAFGLFRPRRRAEFPGR